MVVGKIYSSPSLKNSESLNRRECLSRMSGMCANLEAGHCTHLNTCQNVAGLVNIDIEVRVFSPILKAILMASE